jgi:uncharacterized protein (DUF952 family)
VANSFFCTPYRRPQWEAARGGVLFPHLYGALHGADVVRAHDVAAHAQALAVLTAIEGRVA